jgi:tRNA 2-selenouridine synthase
MPLTFDTLSALMAHGFDTVIDVRSPAEFAEDHVPGAINLPALSNEERAQVGTIYTRESPFRARKIGAALVARNVANYLDGPLQHHDGSWRPLVYCWRGGQRSGSVATILKAVGWRAETVAGGYQTFRRLVHRAVYETPVASPVVLIDGFTGTAKTEILARLPAHGVQVIDLEGLANHRGSLLGERPGGQPSQKAFETDLAMALAALDPARPVVVEAESSKIGQRVIPPMLWKAMCAAPRVEITAEVGARARYLAAAYAEMSEDSARLTRRMQPLRAIRGHEVVDGWERQLGNGAFEDLALALMQQHYDPAYARSRAERTKQVMARFDAGNLGVGDIDRVATALAAHLAERSVAAD